MGYHDEFDKDEDIKLEVECPHCKEKHEINVRVRGSIDHMELDAEII